MLLAPLGADRACNRIKIANGEMTTVGAWAGALLSVILCGVMLAGIGWIVTKMPNEIFRWHRDLP
jgi:hypothetical protein